MRSIFRGALVALVAACSLGAVAAASASAELPRFAIAGGGSYPITAEVSSPSQAAHISYPIEPHGCNGVNSQIKIPELGATSSFTIELLNCKTAKGITCETGSSGRVVLSGTGTLAYLNKSEKRVGLAVALSPTEIHCGAWIEKVKGSLLTPVTPINTSTTELNLSFTGNGEGKPTYTSYENEKGEVKTAKLEVNYGAGYKESALEVTGNINPKTTGGKSLTVQTVIPPENTVLPVASPATPVQGFPESASTGTWVNEPTSYEYWWGRCNSLGAECELIAGATSAKYTPVAADVGHTLVVTVTAANEAGWHSASSKATSVVEPAPVGLPEFVLGEGGAFPVALESSAPTLKAKISNPVEALSCEGVNSVGSITGTKALSFAIEQAHCVNAKGAQCNTVGAGVGTEVFSGTGSLFYINKAEKRVGVIFTLPVTEVVCGALKVKIRGTIVIPITPINTKTAKFALAFTGNGTGKATYTTYENEKGEVVKAKLETNLGTGYKESALETGAALEPTTSQALTVSA